MRRIAVIPCYNEGKNICGVVAAARFHIDDVLVADDNSTDNTIAEAKEYGALIVASDNKGKGAGINTWRGVKKALEMGADSVITLDGDGQHNPVEIVNFIGHMAKEGDHDLLIGSRFLGEYKIARYRKFGIDIITWLYNLGHKNKITDAQSCFRAYSKELLTRDIMTEYGFAFSVETLIKARAYGYKIREIPIACIYHKEHSQNSTMNPIKHGLGVALAVIKWRLKIEMCGLFKRLTFMVLKMAVKPLIGKGLGDLWLAKSIYGKLTKLLMPEQAKIVDVEGFKMKVNTDVRGLDGMTTLIIASHTYEPMTTKVFRALLKEGMNVIDVGANIGYFTLLSSKLIGINGKVWAVEPEPHNLQCLLDNVALNDLTNIIVIEKAASDINGKSTFYVSREECGEHSLLTGRPSIKDTIEVETMKLDDIIDEQRVDLLKTDTEGNEMSVLMGAQSLLNNNAGIKVIAEVYLPGIKAAGHTPNTYWALLESFGFKFIYILDEIKKEIITGTCEEAVRRCQGGKFSVNLLCSRNYIKNITI